MRLKGRVFCFLWLTLTGVGLTAAPPVEVAPGVTNADIDTLVEQALETFSVPGIAVGIVKDDAQLDLF